MRSFVAFLKKEFMEGGRTFKIVGIIAVFVILAVMNTFYNSKKMTAKRNNCAKIMA